MNSTRLVLMTGCCLAFAGCATLDAADEMCAEIRTFANALGEQSVRSVELTTDWGGLLSDELKFEKTCEHSGYAPAKQLCAYLLQNTSTEFAEINIDRALKCIGARRSARGAGEGVEKTFESARVEGVRSGVVVGVQYFLGSEARLPSLRIFARHKDGRQA